MLKVFRLKGGVSPLIATILLIAFAVALGSVIMNWGLNLNLGKADDKCSGVDIRLRKLDSSEVCFGLIGSGRYINFIVDNTGSVDISGLAIWIIGDKGTKLVDMDNLLIKKDSLYEKNDKELSYDQKIYGEIKQVQFIPKIKSENAMDICPKNAVKAEKIGVCA